MKWKLSFAFLIAGVMSLPVAAQQGPGSPNTAASPVPAIASPGQSSILPQDGPKGALARPAEGPAVQQGPARPNRPGNLQSPGPGTLLGSGQQPLSSNRGLGGNLYTQATPRLNPLASSPNFPQSRQYGNVQFLRFHKVDEKTKKQIREDCQVFRMLLNRSLPLTRQSYAMGVSFQQYFGNNTMVYDDRGLTFTFYVNLQLHPTKAEKPKNTLPKEKKSEWELAKDALTKGNRSTAYYNQRQLLDSQTQFDTETVDKLRKAVVAALGQAHNIRGLKNGDSISVFLIGSAPGGGRSVMALRNQISTQGAQADPGSGSIQSIRATTPIQQSSYIEMSNRTRYQSIPAAGYAR